MHCSLAAALQRTGQSHANTCNDCFLRFNAVLEIGFYFVRVCECVCAHVGTRLLMHWCFHSDGVCFLLLLLFNVPFNTSRPVPRVLVRLVCSKCLHCLVARIPILRIRVEAFKSFSQQRVSVMRARIRESCR